MSLQVSNISQSQEELEVWVFACALPFARLAQMSSAWISHKLRTRKNGVSDMALLEAIDLLRSVDLTFRSCCDRDRKEITQTPGIYSMQCCKRTRSHDSFRICSGASDQAHQRFGDIGRHIRSISCNHLSCPRFPQDLGGQRHRNLPMCTTSCRHLPGTQYGG